MKMNTGIVAGVAMACVFAADAKADLVAYWNFNTYDELTSGLSLASDQGAGTINLSTWTGTLDNFAGSTINAIAPDVAGNSLSLVSSAGNGSFIEITFSMTGLSNPVISFATRGTSTGFNSGTWSYSTGGGFTSVAGNTATTSTTYALATLDLSAEDALDGAATVTLRYTLSGATSTTGNNRIDNLQINAVPAPGALAMLGLAGLTGARRRRR